MTMDMNNHKLTIEEIKMFEKITNTNSSKKNSLTNKLYDVATTTFILFGLVFVSITYTNILF